MDFCVDLLSFTRLFIIIILFWDWQFSVDNILLIIKKFDNQNWAHEMIRMLLKKSSLSLLY